MNHTKHEVQTSRAVAKTKEVQWPAIAMTMIFAGGLIVALLPKLAM